MVAAGAFSADGSRFFCLAGPDLGLHL
jgi:hypothetical protein